MRKVIECEKGKRDRGGSGDERRRSRLHIHTERIFTRMLRPEKPVGWTFQRKSHFDCDHRDDDGGFFPPSAVLMMMALY